MKRLTWLALILFVNGVTTLTGATTGQKYICVMHPEIVTDKPGSCPLCNMTLVLQKSEESEKKHTDSNHGSDHASGTTHEMHAMESMMMQSSINLTEPMSRESSGTSWVPDSTPVY